MSIPAQSTEAPQVRNAIITGTNLGVHHTDHSVLAFYIRLDYGGSGQAFGGYCLDDVNPKYLSSGRDRSVPVRIPTRLGSSLLLGIDALFGCDWEELRGKPCRALTTRWKALALGHYLEDKWLWLDTATLDTATMEFRVTPQAQVAVKP